MTYTNNTNNFFKNNQVYLNLATFGVFPPFLTAHALDKWVFKPEPRIEYEKTPSTKALLATAALLPILLPITLATIGISLALAAVSALVHSLALLVSAGLDALSSSPAPAF